MSSDYRDALSAFQTGDLESARSIAERALGNEPTPQWQHLLGLIHCRSGRLKKGVELLGQASRGDPGNIPFRVMLVRSLVDSGRAAEALEAAEPPAGTSPPELALWHARAEAADAAGAVGAAAEAWGRLCQAGTGDWRAWDSYGAALGAVGRWPEAVRAYRQALALNSGELPLRRKIATALSRSGRDDEAADELKLWIDAAPAEVEDRLRLARLLADLGRDSESLEQLDKAAKLAGVEHFDESGTGLIAIARRGPNIDVRLLLELARFLERTSRIDALDVLLADAEAVGITRQQLAFPAAAVALRNGEPEEAKRLLSNDSPGSDSLRWHWLMSRIADALGDPATAFAEAEAMNRSVADHDRWRALAAEHLQRIGRFAEAIGPDWAARIPAMEPGERRSPAFLVGFPRSGTTLLDTFLMGHPEVRVLEEVPLVGAIEGVIGDPIDLPNRTPGELERARSAYLAALDEHVDPAFGGLAVDKLPLNILAVPALYSLFPDSPFIFAQRHPCDCVLSCFMQGFALNASMACFLDIGDSARLYDRALTIWSKSEQLLPVRSHRLVYEELVADPEAALRPLVGFLGLDWKSELLDHRATARARGAISTPSYSQVVQPLSRSASGRWKRYRAQLEPVLPILLPWAERLGYSAD